FVPRGAERSARGLGFCSCCRGGVAASRRPPPSCADCARYHAYEGPRGVHLGTGDEHRRSCIVSREASARGTRGGFRSERRRLADTVHLHLLYEDNTLYGSSVSGEIDRSIALSAHSLFGTRGALSDQHFIEESSEVLRELVGPGRLGNFYKASGVLHEHLL